MKEHLELRFHPTEFYRKRLCKRKCRTFIDMFEAGYEEIHAVCGELRRPIRLLDGVYVKDGLAMFVFV